MQNLRITPQGICNGQNPECCTVGIERVFYRASQTLLGESLQILTFHLFKNITVCLHE